MDIVAAHPTFCAPGYCRASAPGGLHRSVPTPIGGYDASGTWAVALVAETDGPTFVELVRLSDDDEDGAAYILTTAVARALGKTLAAHGLVAS